jgi:1-acyl-sn-glycerol-3-phosphate acyltransferase
MELYYLCRNMSVFRTFWAIYGIALFLLMMLVSIPVLLFNMAVTPGKRALRRNIRYLHHPFSKVFFALTLVRVKAHGLDKFDPAQSYVIVGNHNTSVDFVADAVVFPGIFRFLAKDELKKIPIFGWVVAKMCLTVDRKSAVSRARSVVALKKEIEDGVSIFIFPEGSRNKSDEPIAHFYDGAFKIAVAMGKPILPMTIVNVAQICRPGKLDYCPGVLHIVFDEPIPTENLSADDVPMLKEQVRNRMLLHLETV